MDTTRILYTSRMVLTLYTSPSAMFYWDKIYFIFFFHILVRALFLLLKNHTSTFNNMRQSFLWQGLLGSPVKCHNANYVRKGFPFPIPLTFSITIILTCFFRPLHQSLPKVGGHNGVVVAVQNQHWLSHLHSDVNFALKIKTNGTMIEVIMITFGNQDSVLNSTLAFSNSSLMSRPPIQAANRAVLNFFTFSAVQQQHGDDGLRLIWW